MEAGWLINIVYFAAAVLFIIGLKRMSSPLTARSGIVWAGVGMLAATLVTFGHPEVKANYFLMVVAIGISAWIAWYSGRKVAMTDMPQMIAIYNGMGGGAAAAIAAIELIRLGEAGIMAQVSHSSAVQALAVLGAFIGAVAFSGSIIAFAKLQGIQRKVIRYRKQAAVNAVVFLCTIWLAATLAYGGTPGGFSLFMFFVLALSLGVLITIPIGGADMPVVISLYNAMTGLAVGFEGFVLDNPAMMIAGTVVGSSGFLLTQLMAKAMNRSITNVLFSNFGTSEGTQLEATQGSMKEVDANDVAVTMVYGEKVIIVPGYGMAVAQAQHKIWELTELLEKRGIEVKFAIHPVAGRMPGHMNVLLAEAGVPYDKIFDLEEINPEFPGASVALVIGANDVVNPAARANPDSPIYGMPILDADKAEQVFVIKRGQGAGFSGIENELFFADNTRMCYGDGQKVIGAIIAGVKALGD